MFQKNPLILSIKGRRGLNARVCHCLWTKWSNWENKGVHFLLNPILNQNCRDLVEFFLTLSSTYHSYHFKKLSWVISFQNPYNVFYYSSFCRIFQIDCSIRTFRIICISFNGLRRILLRDLCFNIVYFKVPCTSELDSTLQMCPKTVNSPPLSSYILHVTRPSHTPDKLPWILFDQTDPPKSLPTTH